MSTFHRFLLSIAIVLLFVTPLFSQPQTALAQQPTPNCTPVAGAGGGCTPTPEPPTSTRPVLAIPTTPTGVILGIPSTSTATDEPFDIAVPIPSEGNPYTTPPMPFGARPTYTPSPTMVFAVEDPSLPDLSVYAIEVTQGIQDLDNSMPLIALRGTVLRVYTRTDSGTLGQVHGAIEAYRNGQKLAGGPVYSNNQPITARQSGPDRLVVDDTLNFFVPNGWRSGTVTYRVYVYAVHPNWPYWYEPNAQNNYFEVTVTYDKAIDLSVVFAPMHLHNFDADKIYTGQNFTYTFDQTAAQLAAYMMQFYPVTNLIPIYQSISTIFPKNHPQNKHENDWTLVENKSTSEMLTRIQWTRDNSGWLDDNFWYGMISPNLPWYWTIPPEDGGGTFTATGFSNGTVAMGQMFSTWSNATPWFMPGEATIVHEGGHNYGLGHYSCNGNEELGGPVVYYPYPAPNCALAEVDPEGFYGYVWYYHVWDHMSGPTVISNDPAAAAPNRGFPLMGYAQPQYSDPYTYCKVMDYLGVDCQPSSLGIPEASAGQVASLAPGQPFAQNQPVLPSYLQNVQEYLLVDGEVNQAEGAASFYHVFRTTEVEDNALESAMQREMHRNGEIHEHSHHGDEEQFTLSLEAADGAQLFSLPLINFGISAHVPPPNFPFTELVPFPEGLHYIRIRLGDAILSERIVSPNAPTVTLLNPVEGGELSAPLEVRWQAKDADGDELTYMLQYSPDGGDNWLLLATDISEAAATLSELTQLPGSENGVFRVTAMDGVNTGVAVSEVPFSAPNQPPAVTIVSPRPEASVETNGFVHFLGSAYDLEEGAVPEESLVWVSNLDGEFGRGFSFETNALSSGLHEITLNATDRQGATGSRVTYLYVDGNVVRPVPDEAEMDMVASILAGDLPEPLEQPAATSTPDAAQPAPPATAWLWIGLGIAALLAGLFLFMRRQK